MAYIGSVSNRSEYEPVGVFFFSMWWMWYIAHNVVGANSLWGLYHWQSMCDFSELSTLRYLIWNFHHIWTNSNRIPQCLTAASKTYLIWLFHYPECGGVLEMWMKTDIFRIKSSDILKNFHSLMKNSVLICVDNTYCHMTYA